MSKTKVRLLARAYLFLTIFLLFDAFSVQSQRRTNRVGWPKTKGFYVANSSETIPLFPRTLNGYRLLGNNRSYWDKPFNLKGSTRVFEGNGWEPLPNFPLTMNHCSDGVFMIRWRSANPKVRIATALGYHYTGVIYASKTGTFGYMQGTNCEEPLFKFASGNDTSTLVDIYYDLQFWQAAP